MSVLSPFAVVSFIKLGGEKVGSPSSLQLARRSDTEVCITHRAPRHSSCKLLD